MTEETKKLFNAPWITEFICDDGLYVSDNVARTLCQVDDQKTMNRIARLPELFDALMEAACGKCWSCAGANVSAILNDGCPKENDKICDVAKWIELLRKVRDGK